MFELSMKSMRTCRGLFARIKSKHYIVRFGSSTPPSLQTLFDDTEKVFRHEPLHRLIGTATLFKLCSYKSLVSLASQMLLSENKLVWPMRAFVKTTIFPHFVAGEDFTSCIQTVTNLQASCSVGTIIDHSTEEYETEETFSTNLESKMKLLRVIENKINKGCSNDETKPVKFIPLKATSLICPMSLESITKSLETYSKVNDNSSHLIDDAKILSTLSEKDLKSFESGLRRLEKLCNVAQETEIALLLDAEQSHRQPAIELLYRHLARKTNIQHPLIFNTYQMYLKRSNEALRRDLHHAKANGYIFACKIVRGAYMQSESTRSSTLRQPTPLHGSKEETDKSYDNAIELLISTIKEEVIKLDSKKTAVMFATHNRQSIIHATHLFGKEIPRHYPHIHFAQIKGMSDNLSNGLGLAGYNVSKLVPYGQYEQVLPWLLRRLTENSDFLGAMQSERKLFSREISRRIFNNKSK